jgi:hypothetical protein
MRMLSARACSISLQHHRVGRGTASLAPVRTVDAVSDMLMRISVHLLRDSCVLSLGNVCVDIRGQPEG